MMDHDEMKSGLLQDLIEKLMEMKDPSDHKSEMGMHEMPDGHEMKDDDMEDPKEKLAMGMHKMPDGHDMKDDDMEDDDQDMHKSLGPDDFMSMRKKQMGL